MTLRVLVVGSEGRMGRFARRLIAESEDLELAGGTGRGGDLAAELERLRPDVGLDLTVAGLGARHAAAMLEAGVRAVVGTSGVTPEEDRELDAHPRAAGLAALVVPNFCVGLWLQQELALRAARVFESIEIVEEHHARKKDAPSGTAADTARRLAAVRPGGSPPIPIHSIRLQGLTSNQTVHFGGPGEVLSLVHRNYGLEAFGPGILASLRWIVGAAPGAYRGIGHALRARLGSE